MPGASEHTSQVKVLNVNWAAGPDGRFEVMLVTASVGRRLLAEFTGTGLPDLQTPPGVC